jgi:hypothetical protein
MIRRRNATEHLSILLWRFAMRFFLFSLLASLFYLQPCMGESSAGAVASTSDLFSHTERFSASDAVSPIHLMHNFIIPGSEIVRRNDTPLLRGREYRIDYREGIIALNFVPERNDLFVVCYRAYPLGLRTRYYYLAPFEVGRRDEATRAGTTPSGFAGDEGVRGWDAGGSQIIVSGHKSIGVSLGSEDDFSLDQSLHVKLSGTLARNFKINAILSDQNIPIQPEGTTEELEELEKVFVEVEGPGMEATFGDYDVDLRGTRFAVLQRKLEGVKLRGDLLKGDGMIAGASTEGHFTSCSFWGIEGKQGPYYLKGRDGEKDIVVLAGSERIWVNGRIMKRGETNDYVIDYAAGTIEFTPQRLITSESEIIVDFEYSDERYVKNLYMARMSQQFAGRTVSLSGFFFSESDQKNDPIGFSFSDEDLDALRNAGDDPSRAWIDGAQKVDSLGDYVYEEQYDGEMGFTYREDSGEYDVTFSRPPDGSGDYERDLDSKGEVYYRYAGKGRGEFLPRVYLPLPESMRVADFRGSFVRGKFDLALEAALSVHDRNAFSAIDDGDENNGKAAYIEASADSISLSSGDRSFGSISFTGSAHSVGSNFYSTGRNLTVEDAIDWDLRERVSFEGTDRYELGIVYSPLKDLQTKGKAGYLFTADGGKRERIESEMNLTVPHLPLIHFRINDLRLSMNDEPDAGRYRRIDAGTSYTHWHLTPDIRFEGETRTGTAGQDSLESRYGTIGSDIGYDGFDPVALSCGYRIRRDDVCDGGGVEWKRRSTGHTGIFEYRFQDILQSNGSGTFQHRRITYSYPEKTTKKADLAEIQVNTSQKGGMMRGSFIYRLSNSEEYLTRVGYRYVPPDSGRGNYGYDPLTDTYYPDDDGNYIRITQRAKDPSSAIDLSVNANVHLLPFHSLARDTGEGVRNDRTWRDRASRMVLSASLQLDETTREQDRWHVYLMDPRVLQKDETTIYGLLYLRTDLSLPLSDGSSVKTSMIREDSEDNRIEGNHKNSLKNVYSAFLRYSVSPVLTSIAELNLRNETDEVLETDDRTAKDSWKTTGKLIYRWTPSIEPSLGFHYGESSITHRGFLGRGVYELFFWGVQPGVIYMLGRDGRVDISAEIEKMGYRNGSGADLPLSLTGGRRPGWRTDWLLGIDYRIGKHLTATANYGGTREPQEEIRHTMRLETVAYF